MLRCRAKNVMRTIYRAPRLGMALSPEAGALVRAEKSRAKLRRNGCRRFCERFGPKRLLMIADCKSASEPPQNQNFL